MRQKLAAAFCKSAKGEDNLELCVFGGFLGPARVQGCPGARKHSAKRAEGVKTFHFADLRWVPEFFLLVNFLDEASVKY